MLCRFLLVVLLLLLIIPAAMAGTDVTNAMDRAQQHTDEMRTRTSEVLEATEALSTLPDFLERVNRDAAKALKNASEVPVPTIPNLPKPTEEILQRTRADIGRLLDQAQETKPLSTPEEKRGPQLYVFVSFSMPEITLKRLLSQAARIDASLILRGLVDDDLGKTKEKIVRLMEADAQGKTRIKGGFAIDPTLFERFAITQVPSFVLTDAPVTRCTESDCASADHARLAGDITIDYALETLSREAPAMKASAEQLLARIKEGTSP